MTSVDPITAPTTVTTPSAWKHLHTAYANKSHTHTFSLRDQLQNIKKASKSVTEYLQESLSLSLSLWCTQSCWFPITDDELIIKILSGLGPEYREIFAIIRARDSALSFEELFHKLTDHELFLKHQDLENSSSIITVVVAHKINLPSQANMNHIVTSTTRHEINSHLNNQVTTIRKSGDN
ncbi:PREDICTED: uncharacterized protein LOC109236967 [Nicotiana attenuata]|uniref:uncharacterized protein LOC109236967 n=1 Tax=Nicotiana attenuata TaxID=49451 RepID=UPI0009055761|nr:PREDICTED: uncharacterized protein LOC109236967 [Nicotiana attenuata]